MPTSNAIAYPLEDLQGWERSMVAFLVEKERRSGSRRTVEGYFRGNGWPDLIRGSLRRLQPLP